MNYKSIINKIRIEATQIDDDIQGEEYIEQMAKQYTEEEIQDLYNRSLWMEQPQYRKQWYLTFCILESMVRENELNLV